MSLVHQYQWVIWVIGSLVFAGAIAALVAAVLRERRRPPSMHSAAERLQQQAPLPAAVAEQLRQLNRQRELGTIGDADYARERARLLQGH